MKKTRNPKHEVRNKSEARMLKNSGFSRAARFEHLDFGHSNLFRVSDLGFRI